eukprot:m.152605 g.152605  ORF g.152605 m.152605 type:complete len:434 (+) comp15106_c0_seq18:2319-3620(+)
MHALKAAQLALEGSNGIGGGGWGGVGLALRDKDQRSLNIGGIDTAVLAEVGQPGRQRVVGLLQLQAAPVQIPPVRLGCGVLLAFGAQLCQERGDLGAVSSGGRVQLGDAGSQRGLALLVGTLAIRILCGVGQGCAVGLQCCSLSRQRLDLRVTLPQHSRTEGIAGLGRLQLMDARQSLPPCRVSLRTLFGCCCQPGWREVRITMRETQNYKPVSSSTRRTWPSWRACSAVSSEVRSSRARRARRASMSPATPRVRAPSSAAWAASRRSWASASAAASCACRAPMVAARSLARCSACSPASVDSCNCARHSSSSLWVSSSCRRVSSRTLWPKRGAGLAAGVRALSGRTTLPRGFFFSCWRSSSILRLRAVFSVTRRVFSSCSCAAFSSISAAARAAAPLSSSDAWAREASFVARRRRALRSLDCSSCERSAFFS